MGVRKRLNSLGERITPSRGFLISFEKEFRMIRFLVAIVIGFFAMEILNPSVLNLPIGINLLIIFICGLILGYRRGTRDVL